MRHGPDAAVACRRRQWGSCDLRLFPTGAGFRDPGWGRPSPSRLGLASRARRARCSGWGRPDRAWRRGLGRAPAFGLGSPRATPGVAVSAVLGVRPWGVSAASGLAGPPALGVRAWAVLTGPGLAGPTAPGLRPWAAPGHARPWTSRARPRSAFGLGPSSPCPPGTAGPRPSAVPAGRGLRPSVARRRGCPRPPAGWRPGRGRLPAQRAAAGGGSRPDGPCAARQPCGRVPATRRTLGSRPSRSAPNSGSRRSQSARRTRPRAVQLRAVVPPRRAGGARPSAHTPETVGSHPPKKPSAHTPGSGVSVGFGWVGPDVSSACVGVGVGWDSRPTRRSSGWVRRVVARAMKTRTV